MKWIVGGLSLLMLLGGCATATPPQQTDLQRKMLTTQPHCVSQRQCEAALSAALDWENHNCGMKMLAVSDGLVESYHWFDTSLACRVTKDPAPHGGYNLSVAISCHNMFGCVPDVYEAARTFNAEVKGIADQFAGQ